MLTLVRDSIAGQYGASLTMLERCIKRADEAVWEAPVAKFPYWHVAYHTLFCTDLYLSPGEKAFRSPAFHQPDSNFLGNQPWPPYKKVVVGRPYEKEELTSYLETCRGKVRTSVGAETEATLAGESGFPWLPFNRLDLHLYNIRHVQHHTGQLAAVLRRMTGKGVTWVGTAETCKATG